MRKLAFALALLILLSSISFAQFDSWTYSAPIKYNSTVTSNLTNFPFVVVLNTTNTALFNASTCQNVLFSNEANTTLFPYVVVGRCNSTTTVFRVAINTTNSTTANVTGYVYAGNTGASNASNGATVFSAFRTFLPMNDTASSFVYDSVGNNNFNNSSIGGSLLPNGTSTDGRYTSPAIVFNNSELYNNAAGGILNFTTDTDRTIYVWVKPNNVTITGTVSPNILHFMSQSDLKVAYHIAQNSSGAYLSREKPCVAQVFSPASYLAPNVWQLVGFTFNSTSGLMRLFINGTNQTSLTQSGAGSCGAGTASSIAGVYDGSAAYRWNGTMSDMFISADIKSNDWIMAEFRSTSSPGTFASRGAPANTLSVSLDSPANSTVTLNKTVNFTYSVNATLLPTNVNALLYIDGALASNQTGTANQTFSYVANLTYGSHSWYLFAYNSSNISMNATSGTNNITVNFNASLQFPINNAVLAGNSTAFFYNTTNLYPINCTAYLDAAQVDNRNVSSSSSQTFSSAASNGSHTWYVSCAGGDNPNYTVSTSNGLFSMNYQTLNLQLNLSTGPESVYSSPQGLFYDINGQLVVLYFKDKAGVDYAVLKTIVNNTVASTANTTLVPTLQFLVAFREANQTVLLTLNASDTTKAFFLNATSSTLSASSATFPHANVIANSIFDAYTYSSTQPYPALSLSNSSYYLFVAPTSAGSKLMRRNYTGSTFDTVLSFPNAQKPVWQTIANDSTLGTWLYLAPVNCSGNSSIGIYSYNGTASAFVDYLDTTCYSSLNSSVAGFEKYSNKTYAYSFNLSTTSIHLVEENKSFNFTQTISLPSHFLFVDQYTFVFFSLNGSQTLAYVCYFESTPTCTYFTSDQWGAAVPYERNPLTTAYRNSHNDDEITRGLITEANVTQLLYNRNTYDMKFLCYDEKAETRLLFTEKIITNATSTLLSNQTWGYVLPSASVGSGQKWFYSTCTNGTQRLFLSGLTANFSTEFYSLNTSQGAYYTFTMKDRFGVPIPGVKVSMLRLINFKQAWTVVEQCLSDFNGICTFFLEPFNPYKIQIEAAGYITQYVDFVPSATTSITVTLDPSGQSFTMPTYNYLFNDLTIGLGPDNTTLTNATNISFATSSNSSTLEYYGMSVFKTVNGTRTQVFTTNVTSQPSGGVINYPINQTGRYDVQVWAKLQNFTEFQPIAKAFNFVNQSGLILARARLQAQNYFSPWALYFFGVVVSMVVVGFVSRYTIDGAGVVGVIVLWGFTYLSWDGVIANLGGIAITTTSVTMLTTLGVVAALYMRYSAQTGG